MDNNRRKVSKKLLCMLLISIICGRFAVVRSACNAATDITAKALAANVATLNIDYRSIHDPHTSVRDYIINPTSPSYTDWFTITNAECTFSSCFQKMRNVDAGNWYSSSQVSID